MNINCDKCNKDFEISIKSRKVIKRKVLILTEVYFICPECNYSYTCYYENITSLKLKDEINTLTSQIPTLQINNISMLSRYNKILNDIRCLKLQYKQYINLIKCKINTDVLLLYGVMKLTSDNSIILTGDFFITIDEAKKCVNDLHKHQNNKYKLELITVNDNDNTVITKDGKVYRLLNN